MQARANFVGGVKMSKLFEYPPNGWISESNYDAGALALSIHKAASQSGIKAAIIGSRSLHFSGISINFEEKEYGCTLQVHIGDEEKIDNGFYSLWAAFVDKGTFWGGPYVKKAIKQLPKEFEFVPAEIEKNEQIEKPWRIDLKRVGEPSFLSIEEKVILILIRKRETNSMICLDYKDYHPDGVEIGIATLRAMLTKLYKKLKVPIPKKGGKLGKRKLLEDAALNDIPENFFNFNSEI
jgi:hypothetical protein